MKLRNKKTGKIGDLMGSKLSAGQISICIDYHDGEPSEYLFDNIERLNDVFEDYKPQESLIKDEKIRKAVRAWAEAVNTCACKYDEFREEFRFNNCNICFKGELEAICSELKHGKYYTIAELCGEEE